MCLYLYTTQIDLGLGMDTNKKEFQYDDTCMY